MTASPSRLLPARRTQVDPRVDPQRIPALVAVVEPHLRGVVGAPYERPADSLHAGPVGSPPVLGDFTGQGGPDALVLRLSFEDREAFLSTDRAALPPRRRQPVADAYRFLLRETAGRVDVLDARVARRLVPEALAMQALIAFEATPVFADVIARFGDHPWVSPLVDRPLARPPGALARLLGRGALPSVEPPPRQLRYTVEGWLPPGEWRFGDWFLDPRDLADTRFVVDAPTLLVTAEFWEAPGPRYVHWAFHGTLVRFVWSVGDRAPRLIQRFLV